MSEFSDVIDLKTHLQTVIGPYLGTWKNGQPRIFIVPPSPPPASEESLECIIQRLPDGARADYLLPTQRYRDVVYRVSLINYKDDTATTDAISALDKDPRMIFGRPTVYVPRSALAPEQAIIYVRNLELLQTT